MQKPEEAEFAAFATERAHALLRTAMALTGDRHPAEDLVQTALSRRAGTVASQASRALAKLREPVPRLYWSGLREPVPRLDWSGLREPVPRLDWFGLREPVPRLDWFGLREPVPRLDWSGDLVGGRQ